MSKIYAYCLRNYRTASFEFIAALLLAVAKGILGNILTFVDAPFTQVEADAIYKAFVQTHSDYKTGLTTKANWLLQLKNAIAFLDKIALYVEGIAKGDSIIITLSGFTPTHLADDAGQVPGQAKSVIQDKNTISGQIKVSCETFGNKVTYGCLLSEDLAMPSDFYIRDDGQFAILATYPTVHFNLSRGRIKIFNNLTVNKKYFVYFFVINATGVGPLSEPITINCS